MNLAYLYQDPELSSLYELVAKFQKQLELQNISYQPMTEAAWDKLLTLNSNEKALLQQKIQNLIMEMLEIGDCELNQDLNRPFSVNNELDFLNKFLLKNNLSNKGVEDLKINTGDVIEIYNSEQVQIYRNFEFFRHCNYTLLDILQYPWNVLYERPERITQELIQTAQKALTSNESQPIFLGKNSKHVLKEKFLSFSSMFFVEFKWALPIFPKNQERATAILTTISLKPIENQNVAILS